jgi:iron complex transport system substrate-binding protein
MDIERSAPPREGKLTVNQITDMVISESINIHKKLGAGLLESVYEGVLAKKLAQKNLKIERQKPVSFEFEGLRFDEGFRLDLLVEDRVIIELKSVEKIAPVHPKQVLTYLKLLNLPVGLLINFGGPTLKEGIQRIVNNYNDSAISASLREVDLYEK